MAATAAQGHQPQAHASESVPLESAAANPLGPGDVACPDPAAHGKDKRLQEQASTAALYVTHPERAANARDATHLGPNGKLSSASAATSLKYARAQDLPSFPVVGIDAANSAGSAALLAAGNKTRIEWWKPEGTSDNAAKAALLAKDYKAAPMWQPELSAAGSKAALLAHRDGAKLNLWMPEASMEGNSAAGIAMRNKTLSPKLDYGYTDTGKKNALTAATGAVAAGNRKRAKSSPAPAPDYPDAANSAHNSLNAATVAHKPSMKKSGHANRPETDAMEAARITHVGTNVPKEMFGAAPPVQIELDEQRRQAALRASAISMAKKMYDTQQAAINEAAGISNIGETAARGASSARPTSVASTSTADLKTQAMQYIKVQEQAQKLAAERLSKLEPDGPTAFRNYYGYSSTPQRSRLSVRRGRRRASSESGMVAAADSDDDQAQSRRIRDQMSVFNTKLAQVDAKKRQKDRENLIAAAERKVHAQMHDMDEKVFMETGKVPPAMMEEWEAKARARATEQSEKRMENHGKVHVGGGMFIDQSKIDAIAAGKIAPTLNEINEAAEAQRARDEEKRLEEEEKKRVAAVERERETERKAEEKRIKNELKSEEKTRKAAAKMEKEVEKARRDEERRIKNEEKRKSKVEDEHHEEKEGLNAPLAVLDPRPATASTAATERPVPLTTIPSYHAEVEAIGDVDSSDDGYDRDHTEPDPSTETRRVLTAPAATTTTTTGPVAPTLDTSAVPKKSGQRVSSDDHSAQKSVKDISFSEPTSPREGTEHGHGRSGSRSIKAFFSRLKRRSRGGTISPFDKDKYREYDDDEDNRPATGATGGKRSSFIGGFALRNKSQGSFVRTSGHANGDSPRNGALKSQSAPAAAAPTTATAAAPKRSPSISSLESSAAANGKASSSATHPPRPSGSRASSSGVSSLSSAGVGAARGRKGGAGGSSVSDDDEEEEDDEFVDAALAPPAPSFHDGASLAKRSTESPHRDSRFTEEF